jgi:hypothetical protein
MRSNLKADPAVMFVARQLSITGSHVVGLLHSLWAWADEHTTDGNAPSVTADAIDQLAEAPKGFAVALEEAGWLALDDGMTIPKFHEHISQSAKARALTNNRVAALRSKRYGGVAGPLPEKRREDERREKKRTRQKPPPPSSTFSPAEPAQADPWPDRVAGSGEAEPGTEKGGGAAGGGGSLLPQNGKKTEKAQEGPSKATSRVSGPEQRANTKSGQVGPKAGARAAGGAPPPVLSTASTLEAWERFGRQAVEGGVAANAGGYVAAVRRRLKIQDKPDEPGAAGAPWWAATGEEPLELGTSAKAAREPEGRWDHVQGQTVKDREAQEREIASQGGVVSFQEAKAALEGSEGKGGEA